jgi:Skp family chaperone for outer membrane proteins
MKNCLATISLALSLTIGVMTSTAWAAESKIAIVDSREIIEKSQAVKSIRDQVNKEAENFKKQFAQKEKELKKKFQDLEAQKAQLSQAAFSEKETQLVKEADEVRKKGHEDRTKLDKAFSEAMTQVENKFSEIIQAKAKKDSYSVVFFKINTVYNDEALEITEQVLKDLDKALPKVAVKFDK